MRLAKLNSIDVKDCGDETALDWAVKLGNQEAIKILGSMHSDTILRQKLIPMIEQLAKSAVTSVQNNDLKKAACELEGALNMVKMMQENK